MIKFAVWCSSCGGFEGGSTGYELRWFRYTGEPTTVSGSSDGWRLASPRRNLAEGEVFGVDESPTKTDLYQVYTVSDWPRPEGLRAVSYYRHFLKLGELETILQNSVETEEPRDERDN